MEHEVRRDSLYAWVLATRPKTLAAALSPVLVGCSLAVWAGVFRPVPALLCMLFAVLMQIASNFINDVSDFEQGNDREDRLGPRRACAQGWISPKKMKTGILIDLGLALCAGLPLAFYGGWSMLGVALICLVSAYLYSAGPYPLAAHGWGDVMVVVFFGLVAVGFTYYVQAGAWSPQATFAGLAVGVCINLLLTINNFRDRDQDRISGKKTLIARFGAEFGLRYYLAQGGFACAFALCLMPHGLFWAGLLPLLFLPLHYRVWSMMSSIYEGRALNRCLGLTSRNILVFSVLFAAGMLLDAALK
ncbi:1,4-dihydroxy-2-naphthoate polyprenyltransferase [uncultured Mailhella sp.]|uniref:1,4-dihydroxy-2-naphthoate polyprenyltransferase n=1 Tax=uncultured Mailhella sp. TaxID=1981031 RepID=UPI0025F760FD|nr:1,4-dihydroxy-2-naphthoate polyprenyltransferase [uncultured Mailhella sp.]